MLLSLCINIKKNRLKKAWISYRTGQDQITAEPHTHANKNCYYLSLERSKALVCCFNSEMTQTGMQSMQKFCNNVII